MSDFVTRLRGVRAIRVFRLSGSLPINGRNRMMSEDRKPVIVSLTPLPLSADSRTLKQVTSVHRFGFKSIVVEGRESLFAAGTVPFDVISVHPRDKPGDGTMAETDVGESSASSLVEARAIVDRSSGLMSFARFVFRYIPGSRKLAYLVVSTLERAIAERRWVSKVSGRVSAREIIGARPRTTLLLMVHMTASLAASPLAFARHLRGYLREHFFRVLSVTPRADLYYLHAFYQFPAVWILCRRYGAKLIYDAHDFYLHQLDDPGVSSYWKKWVIPFERIIERACIRSAVDVVTVNEGIASLMRGQFGCEPQILRNVHDFRLDRQPARTIREAIGLPPSAFLVVSIGNYKSGIALEPMLDALAALPSHVHLAFLGGGYPALVEAMASRGIDGRVHLMGRVLPQEVVPFAASADASILLYFSRTPNYPNALPNGFFQSIAAGLPLVYPNLDQISRLAKRYEVGIMADPQNAAEIKAALLTLLEDGERRSALRRNLCVAGRELCWEREEQILKRILDLHLHTKALSMSTIKGKVAG
jgi:glycosyltransferase involved in cell wall biosynthesis